MSVAAVGGRRRTRRHAHPDRHRGPDRAEALALLFVATVLLVAALTAVFTLPFWMGAA